MFTVFTPEQAKSAAEERAAKDAMRARSVATVTQELLKTKEEVENEFRESMQRQQEEAEAWFSETTAKRNDLLKEVEQLEERRKQALTPPLIKASDIQTVREELWARKLELDLREDETNERSRLLMSKLDEVSTKEHDLIQREKRIKRMEQGAETQKNQIAESARLLNLQIESFEKRRAEDETNLAYQHSELDARQNLIDQKEQGFVEREKEIQASMRLLEDQRLLLQEGFNELRNQS